ncbi:uncharacterized protein LOC131941932 [Physella acuta]|uniref:uncharacterized protein LOC131941932 n=1 Tax=Physella acuta TaxID=109671 RepID=UPI0027DE4B7E|nr:uncharacterized protein LOC131941932 [Physella acuta]XP_059157539.1 uncharacterized protein LOC131941932 [Physella acuta]XP_059157540.1 uncharacterized protein LOC131941932 [Physella acuta]
MDVLELNGQQEQAFGKHESSTAKRKTLTKPNGPQFTIPRLKKIKRDLLTDLTLDSHECQQEILSQIRKSFHFPFSNTSHKFTRVQSVYNPDLVSKYLERRKELKSSGYSDALLADSFAFIPVDNPSTVEKMCRTGVKCGNQQFSGLGVSHLAVHVCKHADIVTPMRPKYGEKILLLVKIYKGKVKSVMCKNVGAQLEPTPNYDCHIAKPTVDQPASLPPHMLLYSTQLYLYEYGEFEIEEFPRQILPYAVVYYTFTEPQIVLPKAVVSIPVQAQTVSSTTAITAPTQPATPSQDLGPSNEVWRGRLHVRLASGGQIYIDVSMLSYFVPLTVSLISPIMINCLYPEHNAQFTFFSGLSNIANKMEVEWRAHYFKSFTMRPRTNNEEHFKALIKHISAKREMPTVKLSNDVFLFLMPNCLLASQLGLVRREDNSPVLHCVLMSNYSTTQAQKKKLVEKKCLFKNYGGATNWESLFDDSDFSDEEDQVVSLAKNIGSIFRDQRTIQNKFSAMSLAEADMNFSHCSCRKLSTSKSHQQRRRDDDVNRIWNAVHTATMTSKKASVSHFPPSSDHKPKQKVSKHIRAMPSFSPHGSSDSDSDHGKGKSGRFSILDSTKTVEEELSEEELTKEQMDDIIFLRKPALTSVASLKSSAPSHRHKPGRSSAPLLKSSHSLPELRKSHQEPLLNSKPKIIPTEPLEPPLKSILKSKTKPKIIPMEPKIIPVEPKIIPVEPTEEPKTVPVEPKSRHKESKQISVEPKIIHKEPKIPVEPKILPKEPKIISKEPKILHKEPKILHKEPKILSKEPKILPKEPKILSKEPFTSLKPNSSPEEPDVIPLPPQVQPKIIPTEPVPATVKPLHSILKKSKPLPVVPVICEPAGVPKTCESAGVAVTCEPAGIHPVMPEPVPPPPLTEDFGDVDMRISSNLPVTLHPVFLSAKHPSTLQPLSPEPPKQLSPNFSYGSWLAPPDAQTCVSSVLQTPSPSTPMSPPSESPPSPPIDSPSSPPSTPGLDLESPASPPQTVYDQFRSSPIAIPTSRIHHNESPEVRFMYTAHLSRNISREGIDNADEMKDFLNSGFDSDLDSSYEDER